MAGFVARPPNFNLYWSDSEGNIDFKKDDTRTGMWEKKKEADGTPYWTGKSRSGRRFVMYPVTPKEDKPEPQQDTQQQEEAGW